MVKKIEFFIKQMPDTNVLEIQAPDKASNGELWG